MLGVRLDAETERGLDAIARRTQRPKSQIAREAIRSYVIRNDIAARAQIEWQRISERERHDPELDAMLETAVRELSDDF